MKQKDLDFKIKWYLHFSDRIEYSDIGWVLNYIKDESRVASHKFFPFIRRTTSQRRYRRSKEGDDPIIRSLRGKKVKKRPISYANHLDRCIYSYYAKILVKSYEERLARQEELNDAVLAYRSKIYSDKNLSNAAFAKDVFNIIRQYPESKFRVLAMDISSFFDELKHPNIKKAWKHIMDFDDGMPEDHYAVFKNITKYRYVDYHEVFKTFSNNHKKKKPAFLRDAKIDAFSISDKEFRTKIVEAGLIRIPPGQNKKNKVTKGIPQGSPISPVIANIYMLSFDEKMVELLAGYGGVYRRYSDDILLIYPERHHSEIYDKAINWLKEDEVQLEINESKNQMYKLARSKDQLSIIKEEKGEVVNHSGIEYLGFSFDGEVVRIRSASLAKYYRKMKRSVARSAFYAGSLASKKAKRTYIFKNQIYKKHTHFGAGRRMRMKRGRLLPNGKYEMIQSRVMNWGNFMSYGQNAAYIFEGKDRLAIKKQLKSHMNKTKEQLESMDMTLNNYGA